MISPIRLTVSVLAVVAVLSCAAPPEPPPIPDGVENTDLGIRLASVPIDLVVAKNQGDILELRPAGEQSTGTVWFTVSPEVHAVNLVASVNDHQAAIESLPDGKYLGAQELTGDFGSAFYSRGRFSEGGAVIEETVILALHFTGNQLVTIHYRYPAGDDSAARVEQLIGVLAEIEW